MQLGMDVSLKQTQKLMLTPQMEQALSVLQMNTMELNQCVEEELLSNPMLAEKEQKVERSYGDTIGYRKKRKYTERDYQSYIDSLTDEKDSEIELKEYLRIQLYTKHLSNKWQKIAEYLIECLEDTGYLKIGNEELAEALHMPLKHITAEIRFLQKEMEPCGVFARDFKECLLLQAERRYGKKSELYQLIEQYLEDVAENRIPRICEKSGWEKEKVLELVAELKTLEPIPGRGYGKQEKNTFLYPDITVKEKDGNLQMILNREGMRSLTLNEEYLPFLQQNGNQKETEYLKEQYRNAKMLIKNIAKREETLAKVTEAIIRRQREFFQYGKTHLKPMNLSDIAEDIDMHESTVSRAVNEKYLECRWGVFELKYFFSNKLSEKNAYTCIEELVRNENKAKPYSDSQLAKKLEEMGIQISRRTVAKYREQLEIPTAQLRKEYT